MEQLHTRINNIRKSKNITFSELEGLTSIYKSTLNRYMTGEIKEIPVTAAIKIAEAFGISLYELLGIEESINTEIDETRLGEKIRKRRVELGLSQQDLADKLGYDSRSSINKIEIGKNDVPFEKVNEIAQALNLTLFELLGINETNANESNPSSNEDSKEVDQLVIKCNGVISKVFINGQEIEGLIGIKFSHKTEELAELELSTIVIPNGETLF